MTEEKIREVVLEVVEAYILSKNNLVMGKGEVIIRRVTGGGSRRGEGGNGIGGRRGGR